MAQVIWILVLAVGTTIVDAQTPSSAAPRKTHRITVIGCVQRSEPDTAATGTTILAPGQTRYVLAKVTLARDADQTATAEQVAAAVPTYRLADSADAIIAPHVGEKVQVSGTIEPASTSAEDSTANPQRSPSAAVEQAAAPVLRIQELRSISKTAASCR